MGVFKRNILREIGIFFALLRRIGSTKFLHRLRKSVNFTVVSLNIPERSESNSRLQVFIVYVNTQYTAFE